MAAETAFCTSCGAVVGESWEFCEACGTRQPVEVTAIGESAAEAAETPPRTSTPVGPTPHVGLGQRTPTATYLLAIGGAFTLAGIIYLLATAGFPPGTTTTYEFHPDGTTSTSTSPSAIEFLISLGLVVVGAVLMRASRAANSSGEE
jgi:hypothetical protein